MKPKWQGWHAASGGSASDWVELSHRLTPNLARIPSFPKPDFHRRMSMPADPYNLTEMHMICHFGTHVDAPCHFIPGAPAMHEIPLARLCGPGVVWRIEREPYGIVDADVFERSQPAAAAGDIVLLDTGWAQHFETARYDEHPCLSVAAAQWLVDHDVKLLGVDFLTPDLAVNRRRADFDWPVHHLLLSHGVLIAENLTNLATLASRRVEVMILALNIEGADGAPARVIARPAAR